MNLFKFTVILIIINCTLLTFAQETEVKIPNVLEVIHSRKSVRKYTNQAVSKEKLTLLVKAGMAAPSAMNRQPWFFIIVNDTNILKELGNSILFGDMLKEAAAAIIVCGNMKEVNSVLPEYWVQDCAAATQNILLAAEGTGLGAVWVGIFPSKTRTKKVKKIMHLPGHIVPLNIISIGYPTGIEKPKDKWDPDKIHWNKFS